MFCSAGLGGGNTLKWSCVTYFFKDLRDILSSDSSTPIFMENLLVVVAFCSVSIDFLNRLIDVQVIYWITSHIKRWLYPSRCRFIPDLNKMDLPLKF